MLADDILTGARAAAEFLGISRRSIYHLAEARLLPSTRLGGRLYFRKSELERTFSSAKETA